MGAGMRRNSSIFQSTLPQGERLFGIYSRQRYCFISIHAPARGATRNGIIRSGQRISFQSTLPQGERLQGWTEQAQYEGNQLLPLPVGKVIESESGNNTLTVTESGVNLNFTDSTPGEYTNDIYVFGNTQYNIEAGYEDASAYIPQGLYILITDIVSSNVEVFISVWRNGVKLDLVLGPAPKPANFALLEGDKIRIGLRPKNTLDISNATLMVIKQTLPSTTPYEPYTGGKPSPSPDYPQEITSAGKYNEGTGKYQYEITLSDNADRAQNLTLISDRPLTKWDKLEKRSGQWGWVYKSAEIESYTDGGVPGEYFSTTGQLSTGAQVWYETTTETFVPLSESEQEAVNALEMYLPTTVITNNVDCSMIVTYKSTQNGGE